MSRQQAPVTLSPGVIIADAVAPDRRTPATSPDRGSCSAAIDDVDGQGIYIRKLCDALFDVDPHNEYVAFYSRADQAGRYRDRPNVREVVVPGRGKLLWDQVLVPLAARRENLDVLFHHKFSIPLLPPARRWCSSAAPSTGAIRSSTWGGPAEWIGSTTG